MTIEWFRDLVIVIFGLGAFVAVVIFTVMAFIMFFRARTIMDSVKKTTKSVENITTCIEQEVVRPIAGIASFFQGFRQAGSLFGIFNKKQGG